MHGDGGQAEVIEFGSMSGECVAADALSIGSLKSKTAEDDI